jgi:hypothetical protein
MTDSMARQLGYRRLVARAQHTNPLEVPGERTGPSLHCVLLAGAPLTTGAAVIAS